MNRHGRAALLGAFTASLLIAGCSDKGGAHSAGSSTSGQSSATPTSATTVQPPGTDSAAVQPVLQTLFDEQSRLIGVLGSDPARVNDPNNRDRIAFQQLFTA